MWVRGTPAPVGGLAADEAVWLRRLLIELGFVIPHVARVTTQEEAEEGEFKKLQKIGIQLTPPILCDNKGTVFTANNPSTDVNNKALETRWYNVRDYVQNGLLRIFHIGTNLNVARGRQEAPTNQSTRGRALARRAKHCRTKTQRERTSD